MADHQKDIHILIAGNQAATRNALKMLLNEQSGLYVVAEAHDSHELLKKIESTCPDIVLLDWDLLDRATHILIKAVCALDEHIKILVLSAEPDHQQAALTAGADAVGDIGSSPRNLIAMINELSKTKQTKK